MIFNSILDKSQKLVENNSNIPESAVGDPNAPWNQEDFPIEKIEDAVKEGEGDLSQLFIDLGLPEKEAEIIAESIAIGIVDAVETDDNLDPAGLAWQEVQDRYLTDENAVAYYKRLLDKANISGGYREIQKAERELKYAKQSFEKNAKYRELSHLFYDNEYLDFLKPDVWEYIETTVEEMYEHAKYALTNEHDDYDD